MTEPSVDPWLIELIVVAGRHSNLERASLSRDVERGLLVRVRRGVYVERTAFESMTAEGRHLVRMRAIAATSDRPVVFSHASAAVANGQPVLRERLEVVHTIVSQRSDRGRTGVVGHLLPLRDGEVERRGDLLVTSAVRTLLDVGSAFPFAEGVMIADALLRGGLAREVLEAAVDGLPARKGLRRLADVIAFGHPGGESAAESQSRVTVFRLGMEPPVLQHRLELLDGREVFLDLLFPTFRIGGEVDGAAKLLDPAISGDARAALRREKRREDAVRLQLRGLARWGWPEALSTARLGAVLRAVGVRPAVTRPMLGDYAAAARSARPRWRAVQP